MDHASHYLAHPWCRFGLLMLCGTLFTPWIPLHNITLFLLYVGGIVGMLGIGLTVQRGAVPRHTLLGFLWTFGIVLCTASLGRYSLAILYTILALYEVPLQPHTSQGVQATTDEAEAIIQQAQQARDDLML